MRGRVERDKLKLFWCFSRVGILIFVRVHACDSQLPQLRRFHEGFHAFMNQPFRPLSRSRSQEKPLLRPSLPPTVPLCHCCCPWPSYAVGFALHAGTRDLGIFGDVFIWRCDTYVNVRSFKLFRCTSGSKWCKTPPSVDAHTLDAATRSTKRLVIW